MPEPEFRLPAFERDAESSRSKPWWGVALGVSGAVAGLGLLAALYLGGLTYDLRRGRMHEARLRGILVQTPTVYQVTEGLKEKAPLLGVVESEADLREAVRRWGGGKDVEILDKARSWPQLRIFAAGDMNYFIYFDETEVMKDYVYVSNQEEP